MKLTRLVAVAIMVASVSIPALNAQSLRNARPPAEYPPSSYKGNQYVDSRGCVYIRAGIDGNVTWVPRVSRSRKQICGAKHTPIAGATQAKPRSEPEVITLAPSAQPPKQQAAPRKQTTANAAPAKPTTQTTVKKADAQPKPTQTLKPKPMPTAARTAQTAAAGSPVLQPLIAPRPASVATTRTTTQRPTAVTPTQASAARTAPVRSTTVAKPSKKGGGITFLKPRRQEVVQLSPTTRIVPRHVYLNRLNTRNLVIPKGYEPAWDDDRLNPYRAERTIAPAVFKPGVTVPRGFQAVKPKDDRLNPKRGIRTTRGDTYTTAIWSETLPRRLIQVEPGVRVIRVPRATARSFAEASYGSTQYTVKKSTLRGHRDDAGGVLR